MSNAVRILAVTFGIVAIACGVFVALADRANLLTVAYVAMGAFDLGILVGNRAPAR